MKNISFIHQATQNTLQHWYFILFVYFTH